MNVKISYTLPFEEVPQHLRLLISDISGKLEQVSGALQQLSKEILDNPHRIAEIDALRKRLGALDSALEDCYSIGSGYALQQLGLQTREDRAKEEHV